MFLDQRVENFYLRLLPWFERYPIFLSKEIVFAVTCAVNSKAAKPSSKAARIFLFSEILDIIGSQDIGQL